MRNRRVISVVSVGVAAVTLLLFMLVHGGDAEFSRQDITVTPVVFPVGAVITPDNLLEISRANIAQIGQPLSQTHVQQLAQTFSDDFPRAGICITDTTNREQAATEVQRLRETISGYGRPDSNYLPAGITITLPVESAVPTDAVTVYINDADGGASNGNWLHHSTIGLSEDGDNSMFRVFIDDGRFQLSGTHLVIVESYYGSEPRSLWTDSDCAAVVYDFGKGTFESLP